MAAIFFDTSAVVRRYAVAEPGSARVRALCRRPAGNELFIAQFTGVALASALNRKLREGSLDQVQRDRMWRIFQDHRRNQYQLVSVDNRTYPRAERLLFLHPLRAYDALQLAAALQVAAQVITTTPDFRFCTADRVQAAAAQREGLIIEFIA